MVTTKHGSSERGEASTLINDSPTSVSPPVLMLTLLGTVITALGLFAAGEIGLVIVGLSSVAVAGLLQAFSNTR